MSASTELPPGIDEDLVGALEALATATRDLEAAKLRVVTAKDELAVTLFLAAGPYRSGAVPLPIESLRILYWERPEVRVCDITKAFGVRLGELTDLVGPRRESGICVDCDSDTEVERRSRTHRPMARCPSCEEERRHRDRLRRELEQHEQWARIEAARDAARDRGGHGDADAMRWMAPDGSPAEPWPSDLPPHPVVPV